jgi:undecaprenyl-diphosphatase
MTYWQAVFLGVVQGLTEFLPVSSSGHLAFLQRLIDLDPDSPSMLAFDVCVHLGTLAAVGFVFRVSLLQYLRTLSRQAKRLRRPGNLARRAFAWRFLWLGIWASLPTGIIGLGFKDQLEAAFDKPAVVGGCLMATGVMLAATRWAPQTRRSFREMGIRDALVIGLAQGLAILPGVSRSGATISAALFCGVKRRWAGEFSFFIAAPAILAATALQVKDAAVGPDAPWGPILLGSAIATCVGAAALVWLLRLVRRARIHLFAYYCWIVGLAIVGSTIGGFI